MYAYNKSRETLRALTIPAYIIASDILYFYLCYSIQEAQYLVRVFNAPTMLSTLSETRNGLDYAKSPLE